MKKLLLIFNVLILTMPALAATETPLVGSSERFFNTNNVAYKTETPVTAEPEKTEPVAVAQIAEKSMTADIAPATIENTEKTTEPKKESSALESVLKGASVAATGIGAAKFASARTEQKVDEASEADMKAYLSTFRCNYGSTNVSGGEREVFLSGGNDLMPLYTEYEFLADSVKSKKQALGLKAGIESEVVLDKASSGLYDDESVARTSGTYASLSRALTDKNSVDADKLVAQKAETAKDKKTGMIIAGVGLAAGAVAPHADKIVGAFSNLGGGDSKTADGGGASSGLLSTGLSALSSGGNSDANGDGTSSGLLSTGLGALSNSGILSGTKTGTESTIATDPTQNTETIDDTSGNTATGTEINF